MRSLAHKQRTLNKPPSGLPIKNASMVQIERQRSVAAKAGQMQILGTESTMRRGPIPSAAYVPKRQFENPNLYSNRNLGDYIGRRQIHDREKKTPFQRELEEHTELIQFNQSKSVGACQLSVRAGGPGGLATPNQIQGRGLMTEFNDMTSSNYQTKEQ